MASDEPQQLHVAFFPFMADGHMIPILDIAKLMTARGVKATIITTPLNAPIITEANDRGTKVGAPVIHIELFRLPLSENGLPDDCQNTNQAMKLGVIPSFMKVVDMLEDQLERYLEKVRPDCLVADAFFPWATDSAAKSNLPRVVFHGTGYFALCAEEMIRLHKPLDESVSSDEESFAIPNLPHRVTMTRLQIAESLWKEDQQSSFLTRWWDTIRESELKSYGVIVNSFYELEPDYADLFGSTLGRRSWHIGPVSLSNRSREDKAQRGKEARNNEVECLNWLNSKQRDSVLYICCGSTARFDESQLRDLAVALEASQQEFILVVEDERLLPGFEQRMEGRGLIVRGWAPQLLILEHEATGAFVTHCGWNSTLESISAGVPMVTWPSFAEQFYNEKLVTEILKIGVPIGAKKWSLMACVGESVKPEAMEKAFREIMKGDEAQERRNRAKKLKEMAHKAVEQNGSSYCNLSELIEDLRHEHYARLHD